MKHYQGFTYNPDFEWHETEINLGGEFVRLLIANDLTDNAPATHQSLVKVIKWIENHSNFIQKQYLTRYLGFMPTDHKSNELKLLYISLEKEKHFEILLQYIAFQWFVTLKFNDDFEIVHCRLDK